MTFLQENLGLSSWCIFKKKRRKRLDSVSESASWKKPTLGDSRYCSGEQPCLKPIAPGSVSYEESHVFMKPLLPSLVRVELRQDWLRHWSSQFHPAQFFSSGNEIKFMLGACWFKKQLTQHFADDVIFIWNFAPATFGDWGTTYSKRGIITRSL